MTIKYTKNLNKVAKDLEPLRKHFGLDIAYPLEMARKYYPEDEPRVVLAINTFLDDSKNFLEKSIESVLWIKEVDVTEGIKQSADRIRELARWLKARRERIPLEALYVVDEELMDHLGTSHYQNMWNVKEIFKEKAVEYGAQYLSGIERIFREEGVDLETKVCVGNFIAELGYELGKKGKVIIGQNDLAKEVLKYISNEVIKAPKTIRFISLKMLIAEVKKDKKPKLSRIEKLNRYLSAKGDIKDLIGTNPSVRFEAKTGKVLLPFVDTRNDPSVLAREVSKSYSKNTKIVALYIVDVNLIKRARSYSESISPDKIEDMLIASAKYEGEMYLNSVKKEFEKRGLVIKTSVRAGNIADEVIKEAKESKVDMISLTSTEKLDVAQLSKVAPLMVTTLKFEKKSLSLKELAVIVGLGTASIVWYEFVFRGLDFINKFVMARQYYSGIVVWGILLATVLIYGTFIGEVLKFIGLDTKS